MQIGLQKRARRALERQLEYQRQKSDKVKGQEADLMAAMAGHSAQVHKQLTAAAPIPASPRVLEVGSGAHGLIFFFEGAERVGVDPLADHYRVLFPAWQTRARTIAAFGEALPFGDETFDIVLCDNVVDHAENPRQILSEIARVLTPGGLLYFAVNVHHPIYHWAAKVHSIWRALGIPIEIAPFADHTVHLTIDAARSLLQDLPLRVLQQGDTIQKAKRDWRSVSPRHVGDRLKRWFFKNARWEAIALREADID